MNMLSISGAKGKSEVIYTTGLLVSTSIFFTSFLPCASFSFILGTYKKVGMFFLKDRAIA